MGEIICPNCGSKVVLPEKSEVVFGISFSKESKGTHYLNMENEKENKKMTRAEERIATLKANGVDTSKYFALDADTLIKMENGTPVKVDLDLDEIKVCIDDIVTKIEEEGDVFNRILDGRWIMSQMFHGLYFPGGFNEWLARKGYKYQWKMMEDEFHRMDRRRRDGEDISIKELCFNATLFNDMIDDYVSKLKIYLSNQKTKYCGADRKNGIQGSPYKRLGDKAAKITGKNHGDIFERDIPKLIKKYEDMRCSYYFDNYSVLSKMCHRFIKEMIELPYETPMCKQFVDSYKGNGAYYTCNNLIRFHGCTLPGMNKTDSLKELDKRCHGYGTGWIIFGFMKDLIQYNNFSFR